jgi:hypothetical protein
MGIAADEAALVAKLEDYLATLTTPTAGRPPETVYAYNLLMLEALSSPGASGVAAMALSAKNRTAVATGNAAAAVKKAFAETIALENDMGIDPEDRWKTGEPRFEAAKKRLFELELQDAQASAELLIVNAQMLSVERAMHASGDSEGAKGKRCCVVLRACLAHASRAELVLRVHGNAGAYKLPGSVLASS